MKDTAALPPLLASWFRRFAFRALAIYVCLYCSESFFGNLEAGGRWVFNHWEKLWSVITPLFGRAVLGISREISTASNGSGDKLSDYLQALIFFWVSILAGFLWSWFDRARHHDRLIGEAVRIWVRYTLAAAMISYGMSKVLHLQFPVPNMTRLAQTYGESSPMGLLWASMGLSPGYNLFMGIAEVVPGLLLLFRRTTLLGSLMVAAVMLNVALLNLFYDVPVKLLAIHLCFLACWLTWPDVRRLLDFFVLHHQVPAGRLTVAWPRPWMGPVSFILKSLVVSWVVYQGSARSFERWIQRHQPENRFSGYYKVDRFERAGQVLPPVLDDPERWHSVVLFPYYFRATATVRTMDRKAITYPVKYDEAERILVLQPIDKKKAAIELTPRWLGPGRLTLEGTIDGVLIKAQVTRIDDQSYLLINRGFRWINERPFNR